MKELQQIQHWFGQALRAPPDTSHFDKCDDYIAPSATLTPNDRIKIYQEQYWWRLVQALSDNFPTIARLFGHRLFNEQIAIPYLCENPPNHWSLGQLGDNLPDWLSSHYQGNDRQLILDCAAIDHASRNAFSTHNHLPLQPEKFKSILYLQPSVRLFKIRADLCKFRQNLLEQSVEHWENTPFPPLKKGITYQVIYRQLVVKWQTIEEGEFLLLKQFADGATIEQACEMLPDHLGDIASEHIASWAAKWIRHEWLTTHEKSPTLLHETPAPTCTSPS